MNTPTLTYAFLQTPLGKILIAATEEGVCFLHFCGEEQTSLTELKKTFPNTPIIPAEDAPNTSAATHIAQAQTALTAYFNGNTAPLTQVELYPKGTPFQQKVWRHLQTIPAGITQSYTQVAQAIGRPTAVRAVANACACNNISLIIPCHRIVRESGELGGYRWGIPLKQSLLALEKTA